MPRTGRVFTVWKAPIYSLKSPYLQSGEPLEESHDATHEVLSDRRGLVFLGLRIGVGDLHVT
jgi:hypothetical protein